MLNDQQRSILQELKNRQLSPKQQAIIAELESRDSTPQPRASVRTTSQKLKDSNVDPTVIRAQERREQALASGQVPHISLQSADELGDTIATSKFGQKHPIMGAAIGTVAAKPLEFLSAIEGIGAAPALAKGLVAGAGAVKQGTKALLDYIVEGPATRKTAALRDILTDLPVSKMARETELEGLRKQASSAIEEARNAANVPQRLEDVSKVNTTDFANMMKTLEPKTKDIKVLFRMRDRAESVIRAGADSTETAYIRKGINKLDDRIASLGKGEKELIDTYKRYGDVMRAVDELPEEIARKKATTQKGIRKLADKSKREKFIRKAGAGAVGVGGLWQMVK